MINKEAFKIEPKIKIKTNNPEMPEFVSVKPLSSELFEEHFKEYENMRLKSELFICLGEWLVQKKGTKMFDISSDVYNIELITMILKYIEEINTVVEDAGCKTGKDFKYILYNEIRNVLIEKSPDFFYYVKNVPDESFIFLYKYIYYDLSLVPNLLQDDFRKLF